VGTAVFNTDVARIPGHVGVEDRSAHQEHEHLR